MTLLECLGTLLSVNDTIRNALASAEISSGVKACQCAEFPVSELVFSQELLNSCAANACGHYNQSWTCPPVSGTLEEQREKIIAFKNVFVFTTRHDLEDSFDYEGMSAGKERHSKLTLEFRNIMGNKYPFYGAGSCPSCKDKDGKTRCSFPLPCPFPEKKIGSIEAAGINVTAISKTAGINYNNGPNTVTYFSMMLW